MRIDVRLERETVWLTQQQMAELFERERSVVTKHVRNVFQEGELDPGAICAKFHWFDPRGAGRSPVRSSTSTWTSTSRSGTA